jgi:coenzyme F420 hydrogenase subunit beta
VYRARNGLMVRTSLCTGCGTCRAVCPVNAVEMRIEREKGLYLPVVDQQRCRGCGLCLKVCPGQIVDFKQLNLEIFGRHPDDNPLGTFINCFTGHAARQDIRFNASSGGLVTAFLVFALENKLIDGALLTRMRKDRPLEPEPFIARTRDEIIEASRSKYCPAAVNTALEEILEAGEGKKFAVVGLGCHIQGIRKAEALNAELKKKIVLHLGLACAHTVSFEWTDYIMRNRDICKQEVERLDYRGQGWPGQMTISLKDGTSKAVLYTEYIKMHGFYFFTPQRCTLCGDFINRLADITFLDAWLPEIEAREKTGKSIIIVRSKLGDEIYRQAKNQQVVELDSLAYTEAIRSQEKGRLTNRYLRAYCRLAKIPGGPVPEYNLDIPRSRPLDYLRAAVMTFNMRISNGRYLKSFTKPLYFIESKLARPFKLTR